LKLVYYLPHPFLYVGTDKLHEWVDPQRVALEAAYRLLLARKAHLADQDPDTNMLIQELQGRMERAKWRNPNRRNQVKLASLGIMDGEV
jgi:DNA-binding SARP family transcriptional activator